MELFGAYDLPESPEVAQAPWPRLEDVPDTPPPGTYTAQIPDPAMGIAVEADLGAMARQASARAATLSQPVLSAADRQRLAAAARR